MKKNLRSKILLCVLAGGVLAANTAFAAYTETISGANDSYGTGVKSSDGNGNYTYNFNDGDSIVLTNPNSNPLTGINNSTTGSMTINGNITLSVTSTDSNQAHATGINNSKQLTIGDVTINAQANAEENGTADVKSEGIYGVLSGSLVKTGSVIIQSTAVGNATSLKIEASGVYGYLGAEIDIKGGTIESYAKTENNTPAYSRGVYSESGTVTIRDGTKITATGEGGAGNSVFVYGVTTGSNGIVNLGNNVDIIAEAIRTDAGQLMGINANAGTVNMEGGSITLKPNNESRYSLYAVYATNNGEVNINQKEENSLKITGDIFTNGKAINLNFTTDDSVFNGSSDLNSVNSQINLKFSNGAIWNNGDGYFDNIESEVTKLTLDNGIINQKSAKQLIINEYLGTGDINFAAKDTDNNGVLNFANTGDVTIKSAEAGSYVNLGVINNTINTLDSEKTEENLNAIAQKLTYKGNNLSGKVTVKEGLITPEASGDLLFYEDTADGHTVGQGYVTNVTQGNGGSGSTETATMTGMKNIAATAIVAWRQEDSTLSQRLGELRESDGGQGIWVRMSRGEFEYDGEYKNQYNFFQMGYDWAAGNWHYGAAVSHNDGQTTYTHGDGENRSTSLSLYGTWLGDKGHYADIVLKQGRLSNDFDIYTEAGHTSGDYDAWGTSLSGEYGMKVDLDGGWYVTPQAQLTLMRIGGEDYTTNNGIKVNQDSLESAVGRVGFEVGKRISDSGSIYAKASLLHDFAGSADTYLSLNGLTNSYHQDIGDTWCEAGIGFNYKTSENSYVYADVVKTFGGDVETPWQWNAGMRWTF
jgi:outer membrane autotransporter protein